MKKTRFLTDILFPAPVLSGILASQALAALWVCANNRALFGKLSLLAAEGYLTVPNPITAPLLKTFGAAFWGGLFFTLTMGAGISVFAFFLSWALFRLYPGDNGRPAAIILGSVFAFIALFVNTAGLAVYPTLIVLLAPAPVILLTRLWARRLPPGPLSFKFAACFFVPLVILGFLWGRHKDDKLFDHLRDDVLLSSGAGICVVDFYYRYTLYAAEIIKPLKARQEKTVRIEGTTDPSTLATLRLALVNKDWLPVKGKGPVDLEIGLRDGKLSLAHGGKVFAGMPVGDFLQNPQKHLEEFSDARDRMGPTRTLCKAGLLLGFPLVLYIIGFGLVRALLGLAAPPIAAAGLTGALGVVLGVALLLPVSNAAKARNRDIRYLMASRSVSERLTGLRLAVEKNIPVCRLPGFDEALKSPVMVERRWAAAALAVGDCPSATSRLVALTKDPHPYVRCHAVLALSQLGSTYVTYALIDLLKTSDHWYLEWYAYNAARSLGWHQKEE